MKLLKMNFASIKMSEKGTWKPEITTYFEKTIKNKQG